MRDRLIFFLTCWACAGQSITIGVLGGGRVTDDVSLFPGPGLNRATAQSAFMPQSRFYDVGPTIEIGLPHGLAVEFDALYHRQGFSTTFYHDTQYSADRERDNTWEFPLLLKYKLRSAAVYPFVETGVAPRTISGRIAGGYGVSLTPPDPIPFTFSAPASYSPTVGFVAGGGVQFALDHLRIAPQVRYTRWATAPVGGFFYGIYNVYASNQNQVDILVGISWKVR